MPLIRESQSSIIKRITLNPLFLLDSLEKLPPLIITSSSGLAPSHPQLTSLLKGLLCQEPAKSPRCLPLTADLLSICFLTISSGYGTPQVAQTLEAMFLLAFFGFLRCSEFTYSIIHFDSSHHACMSDLSRLVFHLKRTKTNQFGLPTPVFFFKVQSPPNPFETLANFLQFRKSQSITMTDPLFISESGQVATRFWFHHHFRHVLSLSGILPNNYSGHSFRIAAVTSASCNGITEHFIRLMGHWSSQMYHHYICSDLKDLRSAQSLLK